MTLTLVCTHVCIFRYYLIGTEMKSYIYRDFFHKACEDERYSEYLEKQQSEDNGSSSKENHIDV